MTNEEWCMQYHRGAKKEAAKQPPGLREDAYQEMAVAVLETLNRGKTSAYSFFRAKKQLPQRMRYFRNDIRVPEHFFRTHEVEDARRYQNLVPLDAPTPAGKNRYDYVQKYENSNMQELDWEIVYKVGTLVEIAFSEATILEGMSDQQACLRIGYCMVGGHRLRNALAKAIKKYMEKGTIRARVRNERS